MMYEIHYLNTQAGVKENEYGFIHLHPCDLNSMLIFEGLLLDKVFSTIYQKHLYIDQMKQKTHLWTGHRQCDNAQLPLRQPLYLAGKWWWPGNVSIYLSSQHWDTSPILLSLPLVT